MVPASQDRFATTKSHTQQIVFRLVENAPQCPLGAPRSVYVCGLCLDSLHTCNTIKPYSYSFSPLPSHFQELFFSFVPLFVCELVLHIFHSMLFLFRWIMRTSFEPQSVLYQFPVSQLPVLQLCTRLPCCTRLTMTHNFNATKSSDKHQRLILLSCCFLVLVAEPDSSRGVIVGNTSHCLLLQHTTTTLLLVVDWQTVVDGGGTRELWNGRASGTQRCETEEENLRTR